MKVVCDTNVLISGILFGGHAGAILQMAERGEIHNHLSPAILRELENVLSRPKFGLTPNQAANYVQLFRESFETVIPSLRVSTIKVDPDENRILETALAAQAAFIISGDKVLLDLKVWRGIRMISPADFMGKIIGLKL